MKREPVTHEEYEEAIKVIYRYTAEVNRKLSDIRNDIKTIVHDKNITLESCLGDVDMSSRLHNALRKMTSPLGNEIDNSTKLKDLNFLSVRKTREHAGKKTFNELEQLFSFVGLIFSA